jgi:RNA polymerase sigma-70 factor (ECF subfamily)
VATVPELALLRARYRDDFRQAFTAAIATLSARERTLLRLTALDGLTLAQVAPLYGKDLSTISRWLAKARELLLNQTRAGLSERLGLSTGELDSVMRAADSELHLSLARLLQCSAESAR